ncbi:MAG: membrane protein insertion efficiency factor YidD [Pseudomonadota bacterium]
MKGPWERSPDDNYKEPSANPMLQGVVFYRDIISPVDGDRCPMYPTCSQYSVECLKKHGLIVGMIMTCDRLIHEANEIDLAPLIEVNGLYRCYDPTKWNDFWWYDKK